MKEQLIDPIRSEIKPGMLIGVGTGSTVETIMRGLGKEVFSKVTCVTTSLKTDLILQDFGVISIRNEVVSELDFAFDGADSITKGLDVIKGNGAALLNEKIVASKSKRFAIVADEAKVTASLDNHSVPVEIVREALALGIKKLKELGATTVQMRESKGGMYGPVITEHGNVIVDALFPLIGKTLELDIKSIVGVVDSGLFLGRTTVAYIATGNGLEVFR